MTEKKTGTCALTGQTGRFVKAHLIPKALTRPSERGSQFRQYGRGNRPSKRSDSWYDTELVTSAGESILADLDDYGIRFLRENKMVWSSWGPMICSSGEHGLAFVHLDDPYRLRLFFLSLLWRAAASRRPEFQEVQITPKDMGLLKRILTEETSAPALFYPISLISLSTIGALHNLAPIKQNKGSVDIPGIGVTSPTEIYRFYMDGLVVHFDCGPGPQRSEGANKSLFVGEGNSLIYLQVPFEESWQLENLQAVLSNYPDVS